MFDHLLLPLDALNSSKATIHAAVEFAKEAHSRMTGYHVVPTREFEHIPRFGFPFLPEPTYPEELAARLGAAAHESLEALEREALAAGVACNIEYEAADVPSHQALLNAAHEHGCDTILLASGTNRRLGRRWHGSEERKMLLEADLPVLFAPLQTQSSVLRIRHILVPTDGSELSAKAIESAVVYAAQVGARIMGVYVDRAAYGAQLLEVGAALAGALVDLADHQFRQGERALEKIAEAARQAHVPCDSRVERTEGSPALTIVALAEQRGCDAIFMVTRKRRNGWEAIQRPSQTEQVVRHAKVPVLVLH